jgi:hypothetical protein
LLGAWRKRTRSWWNRLCLPQVMEWKGTKVVIMCLWFLIILTKRNEVNINI